MKRLLAVVIVVLMLILSACGNQEIDAFSYTDHRGATISKEELAGTPWLATFIFTNCETVCPPMTFNMTEIQEQLEAEGLEDYRIVAFSVDPAQDTQETLQDYLANFPVPDESHWHLLTGYTQTEIAEFAKDNFNSFVKDDPSSDQVVHGTSFYLVDQQGKVVNNYDGFDNVPIDEIQEDIKQLIENP